MYYNTMFVEGDMVDYQCYRKTAPFLFRVPRESGRFVTCAVGYPNDQQVLCFRRFVSVLTPWVWLTPERETAEPRGLRDAAVGGFLPERLRESRL